MVPRHAAQTTTLTLIHPQCRDCISPCFHSKSEVTFFLFLLNLIMRVGCILPCITMQVWRTLSRLAINALLLPRGCWSVCVLYTEGFTHLLEAGLCDSCPDVADIAADQTPLRGKPLHVAQPTTHLCCLFLLVVDTAEIQGKERHLPLCC